MGKRKSLGKRGGVASTLVDIYSIFFYVFVLLLFIFVFSLAKGCCVLPSSCAAQEMGITSEESDKMIEARVMLLSLLRTPVELSDGRVVDIAGMIILNELESEDLESELEAALTETMDGYFAEAYGYEEQLRYITQSWEMEVTYRSDETVTLGNLRPVEVYPGVPGEVSTSPLHYCGQTAVVTEDIPLTYDPARESQTAKIKFSVCAGLLGVPWGGITLPSSPDYPDYQGLLGLEIGGS